MRELSEKLNLTCHHNCLPTHFDVRSGSTSLLDLFMFSNTISVRTSGQVVLPGISRHSFIYASLYINIPRTEEIIEYLDYNNINMNTLNSEFALCNFSSILRTSDVNEQANLLY